MNPFDEVEDEHISYSDVHKLTSTLYSRMRDVEKRPSTLIAIGRGGWTPTRILAAAHEENKVDALTLTICLSYVDVGTPWEKTEVLQGLDALALSHLIASLARGHQIWLIDSLYAMGGAISTARDYVGGIMQQHGREGVPIRVGALHWVTFDRSPNALWRSAAPSPPDAYGARLHHEHKIYVHYPWEHSVLRQSD